MTSARYGLSDIIDFEDTADNVSGDAIISGRTISIYAEFKVIGNVSETIGIIKENYRPKSKYVLLPIYSKTPPYGPLNASVWFYTGGSLKAYGVMVGSSYYIYGSWIF